MKEKCYYMKVPFRNTKTHKKLVRGTTQINSKSIKITSFYFAQKLEKNYNKKIKFF